MKFGGVLSLTAALVLTGCAPVAFEGDPDIEAKAQAYEAKVQAKLQAQEEAAAEAKLVRISFPTDRALRIFYAGDSLAASFYSSVKELGWRPLVTAELGKRGPVEELRATKPADAPLFQVGNAESIPGSGVDLAIIELGTNDAGRTEIGLFKQQYAALLSKIQAGSPDAHIICVGAWGFSGSLGTDPYDKEIETVCRERGGRYVDLTNAFMEKGNYGPEGVSTWTGLSDNFHPNDQGHRKIADLILERIRVS